MIFSQAGFSILSYSAILEELASHGYIIVGINHTYDAPVNVFLDGNIVSASSLFLNEINSQKEDFKETFRLRENAAVFKVNDIKFVVDQLKNLNINSNILNGKLDLSQIVIIGHSLGGNAAFEFCSSDNRCKAAINFDGALWSEVGRMGLKKPGMIIAGEHPEFSMPCSTMVNSHAYLNDEWCEAERSLVISRWKKILETGQDSYFIQIKGAKHANFADVQFVTLLSNSPFKTVIGSISPKHMWRITCDYILAFLNKYIHNISLNFPSVLSKKYQKIVLETI